MSKSKVKQYAPFLVLLAVAIAAIFVTPGTSFDPASVLGDDGKTPKYVYNSGDIAWMLVSCAFVFLMTPALAFFYGGMVGRKNVLSTMIKSTVADGIISVLWIVIKFSLCFGTDFKGLGIIGDPRSFFMFKNVMNGEPWSLASSIPLPLFSFFQLMFAIITPGLVVGAVAERLAVVGVVRVAHLERVVRLRARCGAAARGNTLILNWPPPPAVRSILGW